jgi:hypothetical protein
MAQTSPVIVDSSQNSAAPYNSVALGKVGNIITQTGAPVATTAIKNGIGWAALAVNSGPAILAGHTAIASSSLTLGNVDTSINHTGARGRCIGKAMLVRVRNPKLSTLGVCLAGSVAGAPCATNLLDITPVATVPVNRTYTAVSNVAPVGDPAFLMRSGAETVFPDEEAVVIVCPVRSNELQQVTACPHILRPMSGTPAAQCTVNPGTGTTFTGTMIDNSDLTYFLAKGIPETSVITVATRYLYEFFESGAGGYEFTGETARYCQTALDVDERLRGKLDPVYHGSNQEKYSHAFLDMAIEYARSGRPGSAMPDLDRRITALTNRVSNLSRGPAPAVIKYDNKQENRGMRGNKVLSGSAKQRRKDEL